MAEGSGEARTGRLARALHLLGDPARHPREYALAVLSGVLFFVSFPRFDLYPLAFVALAPMLWLCEHSTPRRAFWWAWIAGVVTNVGGFYWVTNLLVDFAAFPWIAAALVCLLMAAEHALLLGITGWIGRWLRVSAGVSRAFAYVPILIVCEWLIWRLFPFYLGNSQYENLYFVQVADLGGVMLLSALVALVNVAVVDVAFWLRERAAGQPFPRGVWIVVGCVVLALGYGWLRVGQVEERMESAPTLAIGLVEADIGILQKASRDEYQNNLLIHQKLSVELAEQRADLIVWPESGYHAVRYLQTTEDVPDLPSARREAQLSSRLMRAVRWMPPSDAPLVGDYREDLRRGTPVDARVSPHRGFRVPLLLGALTWRPISEEEAESTQVPERGRMPRHAIHNSALLLSAEGRVLGVYDKNVLLGFGEYVPFARWIYRLTGISVYDLIPAAGSLTPGDTLEVFELPRPGGEGAFRIGVMICYEDIIPAFGRELNRRSPDVLINITNDAWFGETSEPYQHLALAALRAVEQRTYLVRSTNTGISAFVDPVGRIRARTSIDEAEALLHETAMLPAERTLYMRLGDWPAWLAALCLVGATVLARRRSGPPSEAEAG